MTTDFLAENERLRASNNKLAQMLKNMGDKLDEGKRELLATGWDACADRAAGDLTDAAPNYAGQLKADNPYRKPLPDFSGAMACKAADE